jgi:uncharacterized protein YjbJ (UPF0337 family)
VAFLLGAPLHQPPTQLHENSHTAVRREARARAYETWGKAREAWGKTREALGETREALGETREAWGKTHEAWGKGHEAWGKAHEAWGNAFEAWGNAFEAWGNANRLCGRCWNGSSATIQAWFVSSEASGRGPESWNVLPQASNTVDQAWFTLTQARDVLTKARNALTKATFVAYATWPLMTSRGDWTCKLMWACGLGSAVTDGHIDPRREGHNDTHSRNMSRLPPTVAAAPPAPEARRSYTADAWRSPVTFDSTLGETRRPGLTPAFWCDETLLYY